MKKLLASIPLIIASSSMAKPVGKTSPAVALVIDYLESYCNQDLAGALRSFSDKGMLSWGTGHDERFSTKSEIHVQLVRDFAQIEGMRFEYRHIEERDIDGVIIVLMELIPIATKSGEEHRLPVMRSTVVVHQGKMIHTHASWPYSTQPAGHSFPIEGDGHRPS